MGAKRELGEKANSVRVAVRFKVIGGGRPAKIGSDGNTATMAAEL